MKKIINNPNEMKQQMIEGILYANSDKLIGIPDTGVILRRDKSADTVAVISGGGSGHEPADAGYVGKGMLDACICGPIFVPPSAEEILKAIQAVDSGQGVFMIVKNFEKDVANFEEAKIEAEKLGHQVASVIVNDDCSIDKASFEKRRRGVAGTVFVQKIICAAAEEGYSIAELETLAIDVVRSSNTLGVALTPATIPGMLEKQFELKNDEIYFGVGIHGEPGYRIETFSSSERLAIELVNKLKNQFRWKKGDSYALMVNGLGSTPLMELFIFTNDVRRLLELEEIEIVYKKVGNFMTSNDMSGLSLTLLKIGDESWLEMLKAPTETFAW